MSKLYVAHLVVNVANLMTSASKMLEASAQAFTVGHGMMQTSVIVDLSSNRKNFKMWSPCFSEGFRRDILASIPKHFRAWDREQRCWRVEVTWIGNLQQLVEKWYPQFDVEYSERAAIECERIALLHDQKARANDPPPPKRRGKQKTYNESDERFCPENTSPYAILGVLETASDDVVKAAYRALLKTIHTDRGGNLNKTKEINSAYEDISKERKWKGPNDGR